MIRARLLTRSDLDLGLARLGLPSAAREYVTEKLPALELLLTGLGRDEGRLLGALHEAGSAPGREEFPAWVPGDARRRPGTGLLSGRREHHVRLEAHARAHGRAELADALARALAPPAAVLELGGRRLPLGARTYVMGVVNVTPDSFSDGGRFQDPAQAVRHGLALAAAGADVLDVGGESTRPGAPAVPDAEQVARVVPVLEALRRATDVPLSVDTTRAAVARAALAAGATLVNDVSGFHADPELPAVVAEAGAAACLMHMRGTPESMQQEAQYEDVVDAVLAHLEEGLARARAAGLPRERLLVDPGVGFAKTAAHNLFLLRRLGDLRTLGCAVLVGTSRKGFLGALAGGKPADQRLAATLGSVAAVAAAGTADVVRVHDVAEARDALAVADAIRQAAGGGEGWER